MTSVVANEHTKFDQPLSSNNQRTAIAIQNFDLLRLLWVAKFTSRSPKVFIAKGLAFASVASRIILY